MLASQWVWQRTKSVSIPAEEQNAGRVVDYFYKMEFHITPRFFSDSNYLFFFETCVRGILSKEGRCCQGSQIGVLCGSLVYFFCGMWVGTDNLCMKYNFNRLNETRRDHPFCDFHVVFY